MAGANAMKSASCRLSLINYLTPLLPLRQTLQQVSYFSTTSPQCKRKKAVDGNKQRGVSALYRSGPRKRLSMSGIPLPRPRNHFKPEVKLDKTHGLWGFFPQPGKLLMTPTETEKHGRAWAVEELRKKSWEDLHALWWSCCKERNLLATSKAELMRAKIGYGDQELRNRDDQVKKTLRAIRQALTERYYTWEDAVGVAKSDPEINLEGGVGEVYTPKTYEEDVEVKDEVRAEVSAIEGPKDDAAKEPIAR